MRDDAGLAALEAMDNGTPQPRPPAEPTPAAVKVCKVEGCAEDASDAPRMGWLAGKCEQHREAARVAQSARLTGKARGGKAKAEKASPPPHEPAGGCGGRGGERERRRESGAAARLRPCRRRAPGAARGRARRPERSDRGAALR